MTYQELKDALTVFQLGERATLKQIKNKHREMVKKHHPDCSDHASADDILHINAAFEILLSYCESYQFCFSESEFLEQHPEERLRRQFSWDPLWGGKKEET